MDDESGVRAAHSGRKKGDQVKMTLATAVHLPAYDRRSLSVMVCKAFNLKVISVTSAAVSGSTCTSSLTFISDVKAGKIVNTPDVHVMRCPKSALGSDSGRPKAVHKYTTISKPLSAVHLGILEHKERVVDVKIGSCVVPPKYALHQSGQESSES